MKKTEINQEEHVAKQPTSIKEQLEDLSQSRMELETQYERDCYLHQEALEFRREMKRSADGLDWICSKFTKIAQRSESASVREQALDFALRVTRMRINLETCFVPDLSDFLVVPRRTTMNKTKQKLLENQIKMDNLKKMMEGGVNV